MQTRSLWLVRHGQASFGKSDYDNLSEQGHEQAYLLGKDLARRGVAPSLLVSGSMKRHRQTLAEIAAGAGWRLVDDASSTDDAPAGSTPGPAGSSGGREPSKRDRVDGRAGGTTSSAHPGHPTHQERTTRASTPPPASDAVDEISATHAPPVVRRRVDERWNELDHRALLTAYKPAYKNMLVLKADMVRTLRPRIAFEDTFEKAVDRWSSGEYDHDYPESFTQFAARTQEAMTSVAEGEDEHVVVVTSAGPVCWLTAHLSAADSLDAWKHFTLAAVNTGVTRITIDRHGPRVLTFNEFAHLDGPALVTNR